MLGSSYNKLTVTGFSHKDKYYAKYWVCSCQCGNTTIVNQQKLKSGHTKSCGCINKENPPRLIDGRSKELLYKVYYEIRNRCLNESSDGYYKYGKLGITICNDWLDSYDSFKNWAVNAGYRKGLSIDRIDVYGNYEPNNCRWVNLSVQSLNKRVWSKTPYISFNNHKQLWVARITNNGIRLEVSKSKDINTVISELLGYVQNNNLEEQIKVLKNAGFIKKT